MSEARPSADERRLSPQGRERRMQLIAAAGELFAERGYDDTRIVDIVERAGVAKGLFYWYFDNKEALFRDLVEQNRLSLRRAQAAAIDPDAEPLLRIRQATEASVVYMARHARLFSLLEVEVVDQKFTDVLRQGTEVHAADTAALIAEAVAEGTVRDEDPQLLAYGVVGAVVNIGRSVPFIVLLVLELVELRPELLDAGDRLRLGEGQAALPHGRQQALGEVEDRQPVADERGDAEATQPLEQSVHRRSLPLRHLARRDAAALLVVERLQERHGLTSVGAQV